MNPIAREALRCHEEYGWNVIPVREDKTAACRWKPFQSRRQTRREVEQLFKRCAAGLAVITGEVSNGLAIRDFDETASYRRWANEHPELSLDLPTVRSPRGVHVYSRAPYSTYLELGDGELRGDSRHYTVMPPSLAAGRPYQWLIPAIADRGGNLRLFDPVEIGFDQQWAGEPVLKRRDCAERPEERRAQSFPMIVCGTPPRDIASAIRRSLPTRAGQRNRCLFIFARLLRSIPETANLTADELLPHVQAWFLQALPVIRTKEFVETWSDFRRAWSVALPMAGNAADFAFAQALRYEPPIASQFDQPRARLLVATCWHLQRFTGSEPFFISTRDAARLLGIGGSEPQKGAWRFFQKLERAGVLSVVSRGTPGMVVGGLATSYRMKI